MTQRQPPREEEEEEPRPGARPPPPPSGPDPALPVVRAPGRGKLLTTALQAGGGSASRYKK